MMLFILAFAVVFILFGPLALIAGYLGGTIIAQSIRLKRWLGRRRQSAYR